MSIFGRAVWGEPPFGDGVRYLRSSDSGSALETGLVQAALLHGDVASSIATSRLTVRAHDGDVDGPISETTRTRVRVRATDLGTTLEQQQRLRALLRSSDSGRPLERSALAALLADLDALSAAAEDASVALTPPRLRTGARGRLRLTHGVFGAARLTHDVATAQVRPRISRAVPV